MPSLTIVASAAVVLVAALPALGQNALYDFTNSFAANAVNSGAVNTTGPIVFAPTIIGGAGGVAGYIASTTPALGTLFNVFEIRPRVNANLTPPTVPAGQFSRQNGAVRFTAQPTGTAYIIEGLCGYTFNFTNPGTTGTLLFSMALLDLTANVTLAAGSYSLTGSSASGTLFDSTINAALTGAWTGALTAGNQYEFRWDLKSTQGVSFVVGSSGNVASIPVGNSDTFARITIVPAPATAVLLAAGVASLPRRRRVAADR